MYFARQQWGLLRGAALVWRKAWAVPAWAPGADQGSALRICPKLGKLYDIGPEACPTWTGRGAVCPHLFQRFPES